MSLTEFLYLTIPLCLLAAAVASYIIWHDDLKAEDREFVAKIDGWLIKFWRYNRK